MGKKQTISFKKKTILFILLALKKWTCVPNILVRSSPDMAEKPHIQFSGNICFDPFPFGHPSWTPVKESKVLNPLRVFPGGSDGKVSACNAGDTGSIPGLGRSPGEGNSNPLQYSCLENTMEGGAW